MRCSKLPRLYPILDASLLLRAGIPLEGFALSLRTAGVRFLQYRDKDASDETFLSRAIVLRSIFPASDSCLILNDRASLVCEAKCDGVHVGQEDLSPVATRLLVGSVGLIGLSTHNPAQRTQASTSEADYVAIGPVFATQTKQDADPVVGIDGVCAARAALTVPLVAIGGITRSNCAAVIAAGADAVAVISDLVPQNGESVGEIVAEFFLILG